MTTAITRTELPLPLACRGKVRDVYDLGDDLLMVASDRVSAFDVVMPQPVPGKGEVLTLLSAWWFARTADVVDNHLISVDADEIVARYPRLTGFRAQWERRGMLVRKLVPIRVECVVRGYISGSAWREYAPNRTLAGDPLPPGLRESAKLEQPLFSPAVKAEQGHDENISFRVVEDRLGAALARQLRDVSVALYERGRQTAQKVGLILADTKFEFGQDDDGNLYVMDEMMTPDSSRFWPGECYEPGRSQPSLDKQPLRDWLDQLAARGEWNKQPPAPDLPSHIIEQTTERYRDVFRRLTGVAIEAYPPSHEMAEGTW